MLLRISLIVFFFIQTINLFGQTGSLKIKINNLKEPIGAIAVAFYDHPDKWLKNASNDYYQKIDKDDFFILIENIPIGKYAISLFQDKNFNRELDKNFIGIPLEPFGFGNDAMGLFGPPGFNNSSIEVTEGTVKKIKITLKSF